MAHISENSKGLAEECEALDRFFYLTEDRLNKIVDGFRTEFQDGLASFGKDTAMIPSYCLNVPNGTETGTFLALDLGGTNLRVCEINLTGDHKFTIKQRKYKVSEDLKNGEARVLFGEWAVHNTQDNCFKADTCASPDYIADSIDSFLTEIGSEINENDAIHLGFTFR